jgi:AsmA protein
VPVSLNYASDYDLKSETGTLTKGDIVIGGSTIHLSGNYDLRGASPVVHMKANGSQMPVKDIEGLLPAVGVGLPSGASLEGGTININLAMDGPVDRLVTTGTAQVANTHLKGYDLASKMKGLGSLAGLKSGSNDTLIENLSSNVRIAPEGIKADNIDVVVPSIGTLTGNGTVSSSNQLDFHMVANVSGGAVGGMTKGISALSGGKGGIPFKIAGTTSQPSFEPDMGGMMKGAVPSAITNPLQNNPVGGKLGGLFGGKKN